MPGDTQHSISFRKKHDEFAHSAGPFYPIALLGKEPAWREAVREEWCRLAAPNMVAMTALASKLRGVDAQKEEAARAVHEAHLGEFVYAPPQEWDSTVSCKECMR